MTKQTWTAAVSALIFVLAAAVMAITPAPYVTLSPGGTHDLLAQRTDGSSVVSVEGIPTYESTGQLRVTTAGVTQADAVVSLPELLYAHWAPEREVLPREALYPPRSSTSEVRAREIQLMATSQADAAAAALRAAGVEVRQMPMVQSVASVGPAVDKLFPGDFVLAIDDVPTPNIATVRTEIEKRGIGQSVTFTVLRDREPVVVTLDTAASKTQVGVPVWGGNLVMGHSYRPRVEIALDPSVGGSSAGLMMALAIFDRVTPGDLIGSRSVAGTGDIDGAGNVTESGGVREKLVAAERAGVEVFVVPEGNCADLAGLTTRMRVVSVTTLDDAINALDALADTSTQGLVGGCG